MTIKINETESNVIDISSGILKGGGVISFKTDTVYGIGCDYSNKKTISKIYRIKSRKENNPIAIMFSSINYVKKYVVLDESFEKEISNLLSKKITLVLQSKHSSKNQFIGIRIANTKLTQSLTEKFPDGIALTSANISGQKECHCASDIKKVFNEKIDLIIDSGVCNCCMPSTVIKLTGNHLEILRKGMETKEQIQKDLNLLFFKD